MSSAIHFNLDQSKILLSGNGLNTELHLRSFIISLWCSVKTIFFLGDCLMTTKSSSLEVSRPLKVFFADIDALVDIGDFKGDFILTGDTALFRKLPWTLWGEGIPGILGSGTWDWLIWLNGVSSMTGIFVLFQPGRGIADLSFTFSSTAL